MHAHVHAQTTDGHFKAYTNQDALATVNLLAIPTSKPSLRLCSERSDYREKNAAVVQVSQCEWLLEYTSTPETRRKLKPMQTLIRRAKVRLLLI